MALIVQKYGGSSLADPDRIKRVARRVVEERKRGNQIVVVVSAMGDTTDRLVELAHQVCKHPPEREMDMLLSVGERISIALLAMAISDLGYEAISFTGSQVGIITDNRHTEARILEVRGLRIHEALESGKIVIVAGFQGVSINKEITTLGRGGSDTTALALAAALQAERCEFMKDVDGVYVAEPRLVPRPLLNKELSYDEMIEMANLGAGVLKTESVEIARYYKIKVGVGNTATGKVGTIITDRRHDTSAISGIVGQKGLVYVRFHSRDFRARNRLNLVMAERRIKVQSYLLHPEYVEFICQERFWPEIEQALQTVTAESSSPMPEAPDGASTSSSGPGHSGPVFHRSGVGMVGIVGTGLNFNSEKATRVFQALEKSGINPEVLQVSDLRISWMMPEEQIDDTVRRLYGELIPERGEN